MALSLTTSLINSSSDYRTRGYLTLDGLAWKRVKFFFFSLSLLSLEPSFHLVFFIVASTVSTSTYFSRTECVVACILSGYVGVGWIGTYTYGSVKFWSNLKRHNPLDQLLCDVMWCIGDTWDTHTVLSLLPYVHITRQPKTYDLRLQITTSLNMYWQQQKLLCSPNSISSIILERRFLCPFYSNSWLSTLPHLSYT